MLHPLVEKELFTLENLRSLFVLLSFAAFDYPFGIFQVIKEISYLSETRVIINDLDVILHGFMLQIVYTTVFPSQTVKQSLTFDCLTV